MWCSRDSPNCLTFWGKPKHITPVTEQKLGFAMKICVWTWIKGINLTWTLSASALLSLSRLREVETAPGLSGTLMQREINFSFTHFFGTDLLEKVFARFLCLSQRKNRILRKRRGAHGLGGRLFFLILFFIFFYFTVALLYKTQMRFESSQLQCYHTATLSFCCLLPFSSLYLCSFPLLLSGWWLCLVWSSPSPTITWECRALL